MMDEKDLQAFDTLINAIEKERFDKENARYYDKQFWRLAEIISGLFGINIYTTAEEFVDEVEKHVNNEQASTDHGTGTTKE